MKMLVTIFLLALTASVRDVAGQEEATTEAAVVAEAAEPVCGTCPKVTIQHYLAKQCTPVEDKTINPCCPVSFDCPAAETYSNTATTCNYKGTTYNVGDSVPVEGPCRTSCSCWAPLSDKHMAEIVCSQVECPISNVDVPPGCRLLYNETQCCAVGTECDEVVPTMEVVADQNVTYRTPDCSWGGINYFEGDLIATPNDPCQHCVCNKDFTDAYGSGCVQVDCGLDYKFSEYLNAGCVPLYSVGLCCPTDWVCPDGRFVVKVPDETPAEEGAAQPEGLRCTLGDISAPALASVPTYSCAVNCVCLTPPEFTCITYPTCEDAVQALRAGVTL